MTPSHASDISDPSQKFEDSNGKPLASIRTHTDMTNSRCVLWDEVTDTFANISYLQDSAAQRVFFEVDKEYNLIFPLRVMCSSIPYVVVVRAEEVDGQARTRRWPLAFQKEAINPRTWFSDTNTTLNSHSLPESLSQVSCEVQELRLLHESLYDLSEREFLKAMATRNHYDRLLRAKIEVIRHQGYDSDRPLAFFQQYGQYTLTLLDMIKHGYPRSPYSVPALDTFEILRPGAPVRHVLTREKIGPLVDKSIAHISKLLFKKSLWKIMLNPRETRQLGYRLESIVGTLGGKVDRWLHTIAVSPSAVQVVDIATALQGTKSVFDATIRFTWIVSRDELQEVLALMAHSGVVALQLDGLTSKARIHNFENEEDLFVDTVGSSTLQLVTLLNYPQPSEQYLYLGRTGSDVFGLQLSLPAELPHFDWFNIRMTLERGLARIGKKTHMSLIQPSLQEVFRQLVLEKDLNVREIDLFEPESKMWQGRLGVQRGVVIGLSDTIAPSKMIRRSLLEYGTLRALREYFGQVLSNVQWPTIKSLILIGVKIDDWIRVWTELGNIFGASPGLGPRLSCFDIVGTDSGIPLSRFSALSLHRLVYSSNLGEVCLENIQLQDGGDWDLIIGAFDFATLKSLSFLNSPLFNTATLVDQLKEQLSDLELIVLTSSQEEKCLTFISLPAKSVVQTQYHELDIKGINMSQTNDIWRTLTASGEFQYGLARAMIPQ
ncbi:hypothetical protein BG005_007804 [Podila minutissima]|nr:hypothetical protein BG005_007804 [Podila minutissima]